MTINNEAEDNFNFDDFVSDQSKKEIAPEVSEVIPKDEAVEPTSPQTAEIPVVQPQEEVVEIPTNDSSEPVRAPNEPEWKYDYRLEIWQKQQELKNATTPDEKTEKKLEVDGIRKQLAERSRVESTQTKPKEDSEDGDGFESQIQPVDLYKVVNDLVEQREYLGKLDDIEANFLKTHKDIAQKQKYDQFFNYVGETYNLRGKTPKQVNAILEMAYETLYPSRIEEKVTRSKELEKKMEAVDFSGSSASETTDPEKEEGQKLVENIKKNSGNDFSWAIE